MLSRIMSGWLLIIQLTYLVTKVLLNQTHIYWYIQDVLLRKVNWLEVGLNCVLGFISKFSNHTSFMTKNWVMRNILVNILTFIWNKTRKHKFRYLMISSCGCAIKIKSQPQKQLEWLRSQRRLKGPEWKPN